jgi:hypothetical protein
MRRSSCTRIVQFWTGVAVALLVGSAPRSAAAEPPPPALEADMRCAVEGTAAVCRVTAKPSLLSHISYVRADVVSAPPFLKVVIGSVDYASDRDTKQRLNLAFKGKGKGSGDVIVKVQAMVCADNGTSCPALSRVVTARITIAQ